MRAWRAGERWLRRRGAPVGVALLLAGCGLVGSDDDDSATPVEEAHLRVPEDVDRDEGCGDAAHTEPTDLAGGRTVARCASGFPEAQPLPAPTTLKVGMRGRTEEVAPVLLADAFDEFAAEGITVEIVDYATAAELYGAVHRGEVDVAIGQLDAPYFDGAFAGSGARVALGGPIAAAPHDTDAVQTGFWLRTDLLGDGNYWTELEKYDEGVAIADSIGDAVSYPVDFVLQQYDMSLNNLNLVAQSGEGAVAGLLDGTLIGAWVDDPHWRELIDNDKHIELVATLPASESLDGVVLSGRLVDPARDRAVGLAFTRAVIRTINTYLPPDYQDDDEVVAALAEATDLDEAEILETPAWYFDWEIRSDTTTRIQQSLLNLGGVIYEAEVPEDRLVDRSLYEDAVGT